MARRVALATLLAGAVLFSLANLFWQRPAARSDMRVTEAALDPATEDKPILQSSFSASSTAAGLTMEEGETMASARSNVRPGSRHKKLLYLTFDDGPNFGSFPVLDAFKELFKYINFRSTFRM